MEENPNEQSWFVWHEKWSMVKLFTKTMFLISFSASNIFRLTRGDFNFGMRAVFESEEQIEEVLVWAEENGFLAKKRTEPNPNGGVTIFYELVSNSSLKGDPDTAQTKRRLLKRACKLYDLFDGMPMPIADISLSQMGFEKSTSLDKFLKEMEEIGLLIFETEGDKPRIRWKEDPNDFGTVDSLGEEK